MRPKSEASHRDVGVSGETRCTQPPVQLVCYKGSLSSKGTEQSPKEKGYEVTLELILSDEEEFTRQKQPVEEGHSGKGCAVHAWVRAAQGTGTVHRPAGLA